MSYIGENIKRYRKKKGLTIKELSELCKTSISGISQIESGKRDVTFGLVLKIADALDMDISELVAAPDKVPFEHHIQMAINFEDFTIVMGHSSRTYAEFYSWGAVFDLSNEKVIEVLEFSSNTEIITITDFVNEILLSHISEQRLAILAGYININDTYEKIKENGVTWDDFKSLILEYHKTNTNK
ncbi:helix-turn-helix domain-containing protein [Cytobacillus dafuensis]|uniref:Helix-turn-helix transcriptional regulator n=1 Tax=Cytobacillus dafuensis TaxID=1742359 RepID=A0A5B8YZK9_CYTDA|nr:helix-turn-helix transcriptional regulator [Cytobacillus dafuensis]QED46008.1 helix-turn-helix transcriptional regulator [Cytobacillus dafuensis]